MADKATTTPQQAQTVINPAQIRVAAQVGVELLSSDTTVLATSKMEAGIVLRAVLAQVASGQAVILPVAPEAPPAPEADKKSGRKKAPRKPGLKSVKS